MSLGKNADADIRFIIKADPATGSAFFMVEAGLDRLAGKTAPQNAGLTADALRRPGVPSPPGKASVSRTPR